jgi:hypothetical protein
MAKRLKRNVTKRNMKKRKPTKRLKRKIRHKKRTQRKRIYRGGVDAITSNADLQDFLKTPLKDGDKIIFQVKNKDGSPIFNTYDTNQLTTFIDNNSKYTVYGMIESKDKVE